MSDRFACKCEDYSTATGIDKDRVHAHACAHTHTHASATTSGKCIIAACTGRRMCVKRDRDIKHPASATGLDPDGMVASADEVVQRTQASACWVRDNFLSKPCCQNCEKFKFPLECKCHLEVQHAKSHELPHWCMDGPSHEILNKDCT